MIERHGGGSHYMRPDRVYRTSVLAPMVGYQPDADVMAVTQSFADGSNFMMASAPLGGLFGFGAPGPLKRLGLRIKAAFAAAKARKFMGVNGLGDYAVDGGGAPAMAAQIAPQIATQMVGVMALAQRRFGPGFPSPANLYVTRRVNSWYRAG